MKTEKQHQTRATKKNEATEKRKKKYKWYFEMWPMEKYYTKKKNGNEEKEGRKQILINKFN